MNNQFTARRLRKLAPSLFFVIGIFLLFSYSSVSSVSTVRFTRASVSTGGVEANGASTKSSISADGVQVTFASSATNLVTGDTNLAKDIFLHNRLDDTTILVSSGVSSTQSNGDSDAPVISSDGKWVVFHSYATNLTSDADTNDAADIFRYEISTGTMTRISNVTAGGNANGHSFDPVIDENGDYIVFQTDASDLFASDTNAKTDIVMYDVTLDSISQISKDTLDAPTDGNSMNPAVSADGRRIAYSSVATNVVASDTNGYSDIFYYNVDTDTTILVSKANSGTQGNERSYFPTISANGRYVAFESDATNLLASSADTNLVGDVFVYDTVTNTISRVSVASGGTQSNGSSGGSVDYPNISLSEDGTYVVFRSAATNLVASDTNGYIDVFMHDRQSNITTRVSENLDGTQFNHVSYYPVITRTGTFIAFYSYATNAVTNDTNGFGDVFVYEKDAVLATPTPTATPTSAPTSTPTPTPIPEIATGSFSVNTSSPSEISISTTVGTVTVRCESVSTAGTVTVKVFQSPPGQKQSYQTFLKTNYDLSSTGLVCETMTVCLPYTEAQVTNESLVETQLRMFHYKDSTWSDVTTYVNSGDNSICGAPGSLSPFAIGVQTATPTPTVGPATATPTPGTLPSSGTVETTAVSALVMMILMGAGFVVVKKY